MSIGARNRVPRQFSSGRHKARMVALQVLYEVELVHHAPETILEALRQDGGIKKEPLVFARELVHGVLEHIKEVDAVIGRFAPNWPVDQLAAIDRNILRIVVYELIIDGRTPSKVAINEAVELAKTFGGESSSRFVNGVLGTVMERLVHSVQEE